MADETELQIRRSRAVRAQQLLDDDLIKGAFIQLRHDYMQAWENTDPRDTDLRDRIWWAVRTVGMVEKHLRIAVDTGKLAQRDLDDLERRRKRFKIV